VLKSANKMATTTHDEGFHEIQLNGKQLVFLFMAGTVVAVVIFLLGVFVGRGVGGPNPESLATQNPDAVAPEIPVSSGTTGSDAPPTSREELTYPNQLNDATPPKETLRSPSASARSTTPAESASASRGTPAPAGDVRADVPAAAAPAAAAPRAETTSTRQTTAAVPAEPAGDGFSIQLAALAKRDEAEGIVRRLTGKGYSAYLIAPAAGAPSMYRVRVGKFKDRREAEAVSSRLQKEEQFKPWIVR
jgi:cell division septation protein DedD